MKHALALFLCIAPAILLPGQVPQRMSYQAIIRNSNNALVQSGNISMQISILQGSANGTAVYTETHTATTNINGLVSVEIGGGTVVLGSFESIDWANGPYFLKTETDPAGGTPYSITGTSQLLSVPYALQAAKASSLANGETKGNIQYWDGSKWVYLPPGLPGQSLFLSEQGLPVWSGTTYAAVITQSITDLGTTVATLNGTVTADGSGLVNRGFVWSTIPNPTLSNNIRGVQFGQGAFSSILTGLSPATRYYVRAFAENNSGIAYGNEVSFTTFALTPPSLSTTPVTNITRTSASTGGVITANGGSAILERGVCWSTSPLPTIGNNKVLSTSSTNNFMVNITGLPTMDTIYIRAYAINSSGTGYGNEISFATSSFSVPAVSTLSMSALSYTEATGNGTISDDGGSPVTGRGFCWSVNPNPTTADNKIELGTGTGNFSGKITGLSPGTLYYFRCFAINSTGTAYGNEITFTTLRYSLPTVNTLSMTNVGSKTAIANGKVLADGGDSIFMRGFCWGTSPNPTTAGSKLEVGKGTGNFSGSITGLSPGTLYYLRSFAVNSVGTGYGNEETFTTKTLSLPTVSTLAMSSVGSERSWGKGSISNDGGDSITSRGLCWGVSPNPTISGNVIPLGTGTGSFGGAIKGLSPGKTYYLRTYATNSLGTAYGAEITFTTPALLTDIDGNVYATTTIGNQTWMAENLRTTRYNNGDNILHLPNNGDWKSSTSGAWSYYQNNETYNIPYGKMYNWTAVADSRNVCPEGWHVSTSPDWHTMFLSLGAKEPFINYRDILAPKIRIEGTEYWGVINKDATNESGLSGLPGGWRNVDGSFDFLLNRTWFWTATEYNITSSYAIDLQPEYLIGEGAMSKVFGLYVRCVKN